MNIEIDQSVKIKDAQDTVLALSDGVLRAIVIPSTVKRAAEQELRRRYRRVRNPELKIFAAGIFLLLRPYLSRRLYITIDQEWIGLANEASIKSMLQNHIAVNGERADRIRIGFGQIGRKSPAHKLAYDVHRGKTKPDEVITRDDLLALLVKNA